MANKMQIKRGLKSTMPALSDGELAYCKDTGELYIGNTSANVQVGAIMGSGTWTPTSSTGTLSAVTGTWTRDGNRTTVTASFQYVHGSGMGYPLRIAGLPFTPAAEPASIGMVESASADSATVYASVFPKVVGSIIEMYAWKNTGLGIVIFDGDALSTGTITMKFSLTYTTSV